MKKILKKIFRRTKTFFKDLFTRIIKDDFSGMACEMAFIFILTFFPFMIFLVSMFGLMGSEEQILKIMDFLREITPITSMTTIENVLKNIVMTSSKGLATIGLVVTLILASNAAAVAIKGLNKAYKIKESRPFWYVRSLSILMVIINAFVLFFGVNLTIFANIIIDFISQFLVIPTEAINTILKARWPIAFLALFLMTFLNYYFMPNTEKLAKKTKVIYTLPGTLFFCIFWMFASWGFSLYVNNFGYYHKIYGVLGGFAVLLIWLYYTSLIILIGGEINYQVYKKFLQKYNLY